MRAFPISRAARPALAALALWVGALAAEALPAAAETSIRTLSLDAELDPAAAGALDPSAADLPAGIWAGSDRAEMARLIARLPARIKSPTLAELTRRVLAVAAPPPEGAATVPGFAETRAAALLRMGQANLSARLMGAVPRAARTEASDLLLMNAALLALDKSGACSVASNRRGHASATDFAKVSAFCEALAGDRGRADLVAALLAEQEKTPDPAYYQLLDMATGAATAPGPDVARLKAPTPVHLAMMTTVNVAPKALPLLSDDPFAVASERLIAFAPEADLALRRDAAWRTLQANAADLEATRQLFLAVGATAKPSKDPAAEIARLYAAAAAADPGADRALAVARLLEAGAQQGSAFTTAELARPILQGLLALASGPDIAGRVARGLLAAAEPRGAERWLAAIDAGHAVPGAPEAATLLRQAIALAKGQDAKPFDPAAVVRWLGAINGAQPELAAERTALLADLRAAIGLSVPPGLAGAAHAFKADDAVPALSALPLETAAADGRLGEAILRAVLLVEGEAAGKPAFRLARAAAAFDLVGLTDEARLLATEAALVGGL